MKFYAYIPTVDGEEPVGTFSRVLFELKTVRGAKRRAERLLGSNYKLFQYTNFYDDKTFRRIQ